MAKKQTTPTSNTIITITLPDDGDMPRTGQVLVQRGELAALSQFQYWDLEGISIAMQSAATDLMIVEQNPPPMDVQVPKGKGNAETIAEGKLTTEPDEATDGADSEVDEPEPETVVE